MHFRASSLRAALLLCAGLATSSFAKVPHHISDTELSILAGAHVIYSWPKSVQAPSELVTLVQSGVVGGLILFGENVNNETSSVLLSLQEVYTSSAAGAVFKKYFNIETAPMFLTTDQEGGIVRRIKTAGPIESAKQTGASADPKEAGQKAGQDAAEALINAGFNGNLAPVLGVHRHEGDFLDAAQRSYGNTSSVVSSAATAFISSQQAAGVAATAKHFPGLGAALRDQNTDLTSVVLDLSLHELRSVDEVPYHAAIAAGVDLVMPSWAVYPAMDTLPAGLSKKWIKHELRNRLRFRGVTITDALEAGSLTRFGDLQTLSVLAAGAGVDLLLASQRNVTQGEVVTQALVNALKTGDLDWRDFVASTKRILALRSKLLTT